MAVIYNTNYTHNPNAYLTLAVERAARALFGREEVVVADNMSLAGIAASGEHDVLLCLDAQRINLDLIRRMRPAFRTMILWTFEDPFMRDFNVENAALFDFIFTNDPSCAEYYHGKGHYLPLAASRSIHERKVLSAAELEYDIFFAGTMWPNRVETLRRVIAAFPEARLKLICPGNDYLPPLPADLARLAIQRPVSHEAFIDFANVSAVTLTMFRDYASHGDVSQATAPGPRFFELALAGAAQVVEAPSSMAAEHFETVAGISLARDADGVVEAMARILDNRAARRKMAQASQKSVLASHLYEHRLERMRDVTGADFGRRPQGASGAVPAERRRRLRVLMCTHSTIHEQAWGGVEVYQQTLCSLLGREVEYFYWLRRGSSARLTTASGQELERFDMPEIGWQDALCDAPEETAFSSVLSQYNIDIVHFQHLGHHALSLPIIAKANGTGVVFSAHDFWLISARYNLLNHELRYVEDEVRSMLAADVALKTAENVEYGGEQTRRAFAAKMLHSVDALLFGTVHSRNLTHEIYPVLNTKVSLVAGIPSPENTVPVRPKPYEPLGERPLGVAIVGNFLRTKGADTILSLIEIAHPDHFVFHIFGYVHPEYEAVLNASRRSNVKVYGRYDMGDIDALKVADVALNLSIWPETYCISLSEAWQSGLIPIVTDIGALHDRVEDGVNGFRVPVNRPGAVLEKLELLRSCETLRREMMAHIGPHLWTHARDYGRVLLRLYQDVAPRRALGMSDLRLDAGQVHLLPHPSWRHQAPPRHIFDPPTARDLSVELPVPVTDWFSIQGAEYYIDDICHHVFAESAEDDFVPADAFHIRGWMLVPGVGTAGRMLAVLIAEAADGPLIFLECQREIRHDIAALFAGAPHRSGFSAEAALRGKWCEGRFRLGLVNVVNGQGAFQLSSVRIEVAGGKIASLDREAPSNAMILADFNRVSHSDGVLRGIKLSGFQKAGLHPYGSGQLEYFIDDFTGVTGEPPEEVDPDGDIYIRGWAFLRNLSRAGQVYVALIQEERDEVVLFAMNRSIRQDVTSIHRDAPLCSGFSGTLSPRRGYARPLDGVYRVALINVAGDVFASHVTDLAVVFGKGRILSAGRRETSREQARRAEQLVVERATAAAFENDAPAAAVVSDREPLWRRFEAEWYLLRYPEAADWMREQGYDDAFTFYQEVGCRYGHSPNRWFDEAWYRDVHADVRRDVAQERRRSGFEHYCAGGYLTRSPHWLFDEAEYLRRYPGLTRGFLDRAGLLNGYDHYLESGEAEGRSGHPFFDEALCRRLALNHPYYFDAGAGLFGAWLALPSAVADSARVSWHFDPVWYLDRYPEVRRAIGEGRYSNALHHYLTNDTPRRFDPQLLFSESEYEALHPDLVPALDAGAFRNGYAHFLRFGAREGRAPKQGVDLRAWLKHQAVRESVRDGRHASAFSYLVAAREGDDSASLSPESAEIDEAQSRALFLREARAQLPGLIRRGLDFSYPGAPELSVIISVTDHLALTMQTLASLRGNYPGAIQLIVADSGSRDGTRRLEDFVCGAKVVRFRENLGYIEGCNAALAEAEAPFVLYLNNDVRLYPDAIRHALGRLRSDESIGAVGAKLIRTNMRLQEAGSIVWRDGATYGYRREDDPNVPEANFVRDVDYCSAAFLMLRAGLLRRLGGYDTRYLPAYFEDADLCLRIIREGARIVYDPNVVVEHLEFGTSGVGGAHALIQVNLRKFARAHQDFLRLQQPAHIRNAVHGRERRSDRRHVLMIEDRLPLRRSDRRHVLMIEDRLPLRRLGSGYVRSNDIVREMAALGHQVTVFPVLPRDQSAIDLYGDFPDTVELIADRDVSGFAEFVQERAGYYDLVWVGRTHNMARLLPVMNELSRYLPARGAVLDTEVIATPRTLERARILGLEEAAADFDAMLRQELECAHYCQQIVAVTAHDAGLVRRAGYDNVSVLGHALRPSPTPAPFAAREGILFVGALHDPGAPNHDSLEWFIGAVLPLLDGLLPPHVRFTVAGFIDPGVDMTPLTRHPRVDVVGPVEDLAPLFERHRVFVAPTRFAGGLPFKVHEAASFGLPMVVTSLLAEEVGWADGVELLSASAEEAAGFAAAVARLYGDGALWGELRLRALAAVARDCAPERFREALSRILETCIA